MSNEINENIAVEVEEVPEMNLVEETEEMETLENCESEETSEYEENNSCEVIPDMNVGGGLFNVAGRVASHAAAFGTGVALGRASAKLFPPKPKEPKEPGAFMEYAHAFGNIHKDRKERRKAKKEAKKALKEAAKAEVTNEDK